MRKETETSANLSIEGEIFGGGKRERVGCPRHATAYFADHAIAIFVETETREGGEALFLLFRDDYNFGTAELDPSQFQRPRRLQHGASEIS